MISVSAFIYRQTGLGQKILRTLHVRRQHTSHVSSRTSRPGYTNVLLELSFPENGLRLAV